MDEKKFEIQFYPVASNTSMVQQLTMQSIIEAAFLPADSVLLRFRDSMIDKDGTETLLGINYIKVEDVSLVQNEDGTVELQSMTEIPIDFEKYVRHYLPNAKNILGSDDEDDDEEENFKTSAGQIDDEDDDDDHDPEPGIREEIERAAREDKTREELQAQLDKQLEDLPEEEEPEEEPEPEEPAEVEEPEPEPVQQQPQPQRQDVPADKRHIEVDHWKKDKKKKKKFKKLVDEADEGEDYRRNKQFKNKKRYDDDVDGGGFAAYMANKNK
jgi:hypothetical protein